MQHRVARSAQPARQRVPVHRVVVDEQQRGVRLFHGASSANRRRAAGSILVSRPAKSIGLVSNSSQPASSALWRSPTIACAVSAMIGNRTRRGIGSRDAARTPSRRFPAGPDPSGSDPGAAVCASSSPCRPSAATQHVVAAAREPPRQHVAIHLVVFDDQNALSSSTVRAVAASRHLFWISTRRRRDLTRSRDDPCTTRCQTARSGWHGARPMRSLRDARRSTVSNDVEAVVVGQRWRLSGWVAWSPDWRRWPPTPTGPGRRRAAPARWPAAEPDRPRRGAPDPRDVRAPAVRLHARQPGRARRVDGAQPAPPDAYVVFIQPRGRRQRLGAHRPRGAPRPAIPDVTVIRDDDGREATRFGARNVGADAALRPRRTSAVQRRHDRRARTRRRQRRPRHRSWRCSTAADERPGDDARCSAVRCSRRRPGSRPETHHELATIARRASARRPRRMPAVDADLRARRRAVSRTTSSASTGAPIACSPS